MGRLTWRFQILLREAVEASSHALARILAVQTLTMASWLQMTPN